MSADRRIRGGTGSSFWLCRLRLGSLKGGFAEGTRLNGAPLTLVIPETTSFISGFDQVFSKIVSVDNVVERGDRGAPRCPFEVATGAVSLDSAGPGGLAPGPGRGRRPDREYY